MASYTASQASLRPCQARSGRNCAPQSSGRTPAPLSQRPGPLVSSMAGIQLPALCHAPSRSLQRSTGQPRDMGVRCAQAISDIADLPKPVLASEGPWFPDLVLPQHEFDHTGKGKPVDLLVAGGGPAGLSVAARCAAAGLSVCVVDPNPLGEWPNNYGVWMDEFEAMGLEDTIETVWPRASVQLDTGKEWERELARPYGRVDRKKMKKRLLDECIANGVTFAEKRVGDSQHGGGGTQIMMGDKTSVQTVLVLDATGHARKLVEFDKEFDPGYQGAYGIMVEVDDHPFDLDTMLFMDWRDDHLDPYPALKERNRKLPTFLYVMPFGKNKIFLEETSLVAKPAVPFDDLKERLKIRVNHLGINIKSIVEEEYCLIPMGGALPKNPQRVLGIGGTGGLVHPSTGYMVARTLAAVPSVADTIIEELSLARSSARADQGLGEEDPVVLPEHAVDGISAKVWKALWPRERLEQREFFLFGEEVLLSLDVNETREFFTAFFALSKFHWHGFLSSRLSFVELIVFGLALFKESSNRSRANLVVKGAPGLAKMMANISTFKAADGKL